MRHSVTGPARARAGRVTMLVLVPLALLVALAACSKSGSNNSSPPGSAGVGTSSTDAVANPGNGTKAGPCDEKTLSPVIEAKLSGAKVSELACNGTQAAATVVGASGINGDGVVLLQVKQGVWTVVASGSIDADPNTLVPADFSIATYNIWRGKYDDSRGLTKPVSTVSLLPTTTAPFCYSADQKCESTTILDSVDDPVAPVTVATTASTVAPVETTPDTPPTTPTPTNPPTTKGTSAFCKTHQLDARCLADPSFPG